MPEFNPQYYWLVVPRGAGLPAPTVAAFTPNFSKASGGDPVAVTGTHFAAGSVPTIAGVVQDSIVVMSAVLITCLTAPHDPGVFSAGVINADGKESNAVPFTYLEGDDIITQDGDKLITQDGKQLITQR